MRKFQVRLARTETRCFEIEVEAENEDQAKVDALNQAGNINFYDGSCKEPEYHVEDIEELDS